MDFIKGILNKLGAGFLYGAGFIVGVSILSIYVMPLVQDKIIDESEEKMSSMFTEYDESANLITKVTSENIGDGKFTLLGNIENKGSESWSSVTLKAELYDHEGNFIEQCEEYVRQLSKPGSIINFKLSCGSSCTKLQIDKYKTYKLIITDARHKR